MGAHVQAKMHYQSLLFAVPLLVAAQSDQVDAYVPQNVTCPKDLKVIGAGNLSAEERKWRDGRLMKAHAALGDYLENAKIPDFNISNFTNSLKAEDAPVVGLAISGGGTQSGVGGLGIWQAFDSRYGPAVDAGTGGLTQLLSYLTGLSGGGAVTVAALSANNFSSTEELTKAVNFSVNYVVGPDGNATEYQTNIFENVGAKAEAGFPVSATDAFGQFWSTYLNEDWMFGNFSDVAANGTSFTAHEGPMPLVSFAEVLPGYSPQVHGIFYPGNNGTNGFELTAYEISPFYFGSWAGGRVQAFMPTKYLGTNMSDGKPTSDQCFVGFDKMTFVQGTTATAFNFWFIDDWYGIPLFAKRALSRLWRRQSDDIQVPPDQEDNPLVEIVNQTATYFNESFGDAMYAIYPNPFNNLKNAPYMKNNSYLLLLDGSETGETIPIRPLITPHRAVDFIIAYDSSSDEPMYDWVNGTNLYNTYRASNGSRGALPFPEIPPATTLVNTNATSRPTFFGCDAAADVPLVLYLPNYPWSAYTNFTYTKPSFTDVQLNTTLENAFNVATYGNGKAPNGEGEGWAACLACAVIKKSLQRAKMKEPEACTKCWEQHCWNGTMNNKTVDVGSGPRLVLNDTLSFAEWNKTVWESQGDGAGSGSN